MINFEALGHESGTRVDVLVARELPALSRSYIKRLAKEGKITFDGKVVTTGYKVKRPGMVCIDYDPEELSQIPDIDVPILYEDEDILVLNKPTGVISHARGRYWDEASVASFVRTRLTDSDEDFRAGIVHRLDRATSGVIVCAKTTLAKESLQKQFSDRTVKKFYRAIIPTKLDMPSEGKIDKPILRNPKHPSTFKVDAKGKEAQTEFSIVSANETYTQLELRPRTGRTHQLRVHLASINAPIVGDYIYDGLEHERLMLHAHRLSFTHPATSDKVSFEAPLPPEFDQLT